MFIRHMHFKDGSIVWGSVLLFLVVLSSCSQSPATGSTQPTKTAVSSPYVPTPTPTPTLTTSPRPSPTSSPKTAPAYYAAHLVLRGGAHPDDLIFDPQGRLLFSDARSGTIERVNADGSLTRILTDPAIPEGLVFLPGGTLIFAEQRTNRILSLAPGSSTPTLVRNLPGTPSSASCKDGVDGIVLDPTTNTLIIPDSPIGNVYRMSLDGKTFTLLASGIVRPVGAGVDPQGNIYVADECGGAIYRITPSGQKTRFGGFGMPDDVLPDGYGNLLLVDLQPSIHALIRFNPITGHPVTLASQGYIEPQGLAIDVQGNIFVSDDYSNIIMKYVPAFGA